MDPKCLVAKDIDIIENQCYGTVPILSCPVLSDMYMREQCSLFLSAAVMF